MNCKKGYTLYFDFETKDPDLRESGSCYIWNPEFRILGMSYAIDDQQAKYTTDQDEMRELISNALILVAHNAVYEIGCITALGIKDCVKYKPVFCTRIASKLENNLRNSHSLDFLGKSLLNKDKDQNRFGRLVLSHEYPDGSKLVDLPKKYYQTDDQEYKEKTLLKYTKKATSWAMQNLDIIETIAPELIAEYAISDTEITRELHKFFLTKLDKYLYSTFSDLSKIVVAMREKGVKIDMVAAQEAYEVLDDKLNQLQQEAEDKGWWCNYGSNKQLTELLLGLGIDLPLNASGNYSCAKNVLENLEHPIAKHILEWRKIKKARDDFVGMLIENSKNGRIHGTMNILGAGATGRFSHNSPNLAQIPSRDKLIGPLMRSLFIPEDNETWFSLDFSAQEPRLYVDLAMKCQKAKPIYKKQKYDRLQNKWVFCKQNTVYNCPMIEGLVQEYRNNPQLDSHSFNQNLIKQTTGIEIDRSTTKIFALGKAYGKGVKSTAEQLGVTYEKALEFSKAFDEAAPYISMTSDYAQYLFVNRGYITTLLGRKNKFDGIGYRAYNYRIQGSASDQTAMCMINAYYQENIIPSLVIHDEINITGTRKQAENLKEIMETAIELEIPSYTEIGEGESWAEAK